MLDGMKGGGLVLGALVAAVAVGGIAWFAMSMDGPVEPANKAAVRRRFARSVSVKASRRCSNASSSFFPWACAPGTSEAGSGCKQILRPPERRHRRPGAPQSG